MIIGDLLMRALLVRALGGDAAVTVAAIIDPPTQQQRRSGADLLPAPSPSGDDELTGDQQALLMALAFLATASEDPPEGRTCSLICAEPEVHAILRELAGDDEVAARFDASSARGQGPKAVMEFAELVARRVCDDESPDA